MKIVIAGIYRSGSTWLYNAVRLLMKSEGYNVKGYFKGWGIDPNYDVHIIKTHAFYKDLASEADFVITSYRNHKAIALSMKRQKERGVHEDFVNATKHKDLDKFLRWLLEWNMYACYMMEYEKFTRNPRKIIKDLYKVLECKKANIDDVYNQVMALTSPEEGYNEVTLLTETHDRQRMQ